MPFIDTHSALLGCDGYLDPLYDYGDGVHLSVKGYDRLGRTIAPEVDVITSGMSPCPEPIRITCIGDSITRGYPYSEYSPAIKEKQGFVPYPDHLRAQGREILNRGINGDTTNGVLHRILDRVLVDRPDLTIVLVGVNDLFMGAQVERTLTLWKDIVDAFKVERLQMISCSPTPVARGI